MDEKPALAFIGGSGLYKFQAIEDPQTVEIDTPFGQPSSPIVIGRLAGRKIAFLSRHGYGHTIPPGRINNQANIYALKSLGVKHLVGINACGSLREDYKPGDIVIPDQIFDFTHNRTRSFFETGLVAHVGVADPYCQDLSRQVWEAVDSVGATVHLGGVFINIEGPRFSTRAESNLYREWGMAIIGMTTCPEIFLAREAEMCYSTMAHVTDYDVWHTTEEAVSVDLVVQTFHKNIKIAQKSIVALSKILSEPETCKCQNALAGSFITQQESMSPEIKKKLKILIEKYITE